MKPKKLITSPTPVTVKYVTEYDVVVFWSGPGNPRVTRTNVLEVDGPLGTAMYLLDFFPSWGLPRAVLVTKRR